jgi:hypothetical protein
MEYMLWRRLHWWLTRLDRVCMSVVQRLFGTVRLDKDHMRPARWLLGRNRRSMEYMWLWLFPYQERMNQGRRLYMTHGRGGCSMYPQRINYMRWNLARAEQSQEDKMSNPLSRSCY